MVIYTEKPFGMLPSMRECHLFKMEGGEHSPIKSSSYSTVLRSCNSTMNSCSLKCIREGAAVLSLDNSYAKGFSVLRNIKRKISLGKNITKHNIFLLSSTLQRYEWNDTSCIYLIRMLGNWVNVKYVNFTVQIRYNLLYR